MNLRPAIRQKDLRPNWRRPGTVFIIYALLLQAFFLPAQSSLETSRQFEGAINCTRLPDSDHPAPGKSPEVPCECPAICAGGLTAWGTANDSPVLSIPAFDQTHGHQPIFQPSRPSTSRVARVFIRGPPVPGDDA